MAMLDVKDLSVDFLVEGRKLPAVSNASFSVEKGEILALVGESGCGKSVSCMALARLVPEPPGVYSGGSITFHHEDKTYDVLSLDKKNLREFRRHRISYIFQEPSASLNPVFRVGEQIAESIYLRGDVEDEATARKEIISVLKQVGIAEPEQKMLCYPHELSGGMQQRIMIAMALASKPDLLVADEPTTALDVTIQAQILELLREIRGKSGMSIILVTHNLGIVADMADNVVVMYAGHVVECATAKTIMQEPLHPYTRALISAVPRLQHQTEKLSTIPGNVPSPANYPGGCRFFGRCQLADTLTADKQALCISTIPEIQEKRKGHSCRCHYSK
ncbi:MAG TPA: ABC transporter ATP-binding protein [Lentisphaeria bacterium]|nr:MAG: dipeptide/oligopeptide/nickel ABC transporter ATP-binding protein [Lentisphaerae bacterium GWF2_50_93]HCE44826.1 ABC transporter ATP-binding protein [Lentisphaeria bacterium]